jgi:HTH-type transcriptional regulator/antitoxin HigA
MKIIKTKKNYHEALRRFEEIFSAKRGMKESDEADVLVLLIRDFEDKNLIIDAPGTLEAIKYRIE